MRPSPPYAQDDPFISVFSGGNFQTCFISYVFEVSAGRMPICVYMMRKKLPPDDVTPAENEGHDISYHYDESLK